MKVLINLTLAALMAVFLSGCIVIGGGDNDNWNGDEWRSIQKENRKVIANLELNTERSRIISRMGAADFSEAFSKQGDEYRILYYRTQHHHSDGETSIDETTPLIFKNDKLVGWGHDALINVKP